MTVRKLNLSFQLLTWSETTIRQTNQPDTIVIGPWTSGKLCFV